MSQFASTLKQRSPLPAQEEVESLKLVLADRDAVLEERSRATTCAHAELEDRHKDTLLGLRETQDKVSSGVCLCASLGKC